MDDSPDAGATGQAHFPLEPRRISLPVVLAGLPVVTLTTTGRRSGLPWATHLIAIPWQDTLALLGTNFGQPTTPAWTLNLEADPTATVSHAGTTVTVRARSATPRERTIILTMAATRFAGAANYEQRLSGRRPVGIFVLEQLRPDSPPSPPT